MLKLFTLEMSLKCTDIAFCVRLEKSDETIKYFVKNEELSFKPLGEADSKAESTKENDSKILQENAEMQDLDSRRQDFGDKMGAL